MPLLKAIENDPTATWEFKDPRVPTMVEGVLDDDLHFELEDYPDWLDFELCEVGMECVFDTHSWVDAALAEGMCPGQRFILLVDPPEYYKDYWGECDVDYSWQFAWKEPLSEEEHADRWMEWIERGDREDVRRLYKLMTEEEEGGAWVLIRDTTEESSSPSCPSPGRNESPNY